MTCTPAYPTNVLEELEWQHHLLQYDSFPIRRQLLAMTEPEVESVEDTARAAGKVAAADAADDETARRRAHPCKYLHSSRLIEIFALFIRLAVIPCAFRAGPGAEFVIPCALRAGRGAEFVIPCALRADPGAEFVRLESWSWCRVMINFFNCLYSIFLSSESYKSYVIKW